MAVEQNYTIETLILLQKLKKIQEEGNDYRDSEAKNTMRLVVYMMNRYPEKVLSFAGGSGSNDRESWRPYIAREITENGGMCINIDQGPRWEELKTSNYIHHQRDLINDLNVLDFNAIEYGQAIGCEGSSLDMVECSNFLGVYSYDDLSRVGSNPSNILEEMLWKIKVSPQEAMDLMRKNIAAFSIWALKDDGILMFNRRIYNKDKIPTLLK